MSVLRFLSKAAFGANAVYQIALAAILTISIVKEIHRVSIKKDEK